MSNEGSPDTDRQTQLARSSTLPARQTQLARSSTLPLRQTQLAARRLSMREFASTFNSPRAEDGTIERSKLYDSRRRSTIAQAPQSRSSQLLSTSVAYLVDLQNQGECPKRQSALDLGAIFPVGGDIFLESRDDGGDSKVGPRDSWAAAIQKLGNYLATSEKFKRFSMRVHKPPTRLWLGLDPYPWMSQLMETAGADLVLMGSDSDVLTKVHGFAVSSGFRPILLHVVEDGDMQKRVELSRSHNYQRRGDLQFGTLI